MTAPGTESLSLPPPPKKRSLARFGCLVLVVLGAVFLLAAMIVPCAIPARSTAQRYACITNLRMMEGAQSQLAEQKQLDPDAPYQLEDLGPYLKSSKVPTCPSGGVYTPGKTIKDAPTCSIKGHQLE